MSVSLAVRVIISFLLLLAGIGQALAQSSDSVTLILKWQDNFEFAGFYMAKEKGFFSDEGLEVEFSTEINRDTILKKVQVPGTYFTLNSNVLIHRSQGHEIVVALPLFQHSPGVFFTYKNSNIQHPQDLDGKSIIIPERMFPELVLMLDMEGIDLNNTKIDSTWSPQKFYDREMDAISHYSLDIVSMPDPDSIHIIRPVHYGVDFYGESLITSEYEMENHLDRVKKMRRATIKGWQYVFENPDETIETIYQKYNSGLDRYDLELQLREVRNLMMPDVVDVGHNNLGRWGAMIYQLKRMDLIDQDFDPDGMFFEDYVEEEAIQLRNYLYAGIIFIIVVVGGIIIQFLINRRLSRLIEKQTKKLKNRNDELNKTNQELDNFVYRVTHDLRAPLASSMSIINLIRTDKKTKPEQYLDMMETSLKRLDNFIEDVLTYTRNTRTEVVYETINLKELITNTVNSLKFQDEKVEVEIDAPDCEKIKSDTSRLGVVLNNLVSNAFRYSDDSKDRKWVKIKANCEENQFQLFVEDNGIGIAEEYKEQVFKMFFRATETKQGSGLGLYIVDEVIKSLNGTIEMKSTPRQGTKFTITIPQ